MSSHIYTQNRELSWLAFNERVLAEAADESVPILERLKFASIFTSNLDEFFMIRVGSLWDLKGIEPERHDSRSNMTPEEQLHAIYAAVRPLYRTREAVCVGLERLLRRYGISRLEWSELTGSEKKFCQRYFRAEVEPIISPQIVDTHHPFPHLKNNVLHIGAWVKYHSRDVFGVIPLPDVLPSVLFLPCDDGLRYIHMEELLLHHTEDIFSNYDVRAKCVFRVTRNADINPEDEAFDMDENEDFRKKMKKALRQRTRLAPVRLELSERIGGSFLDYLKDRLPVMDEQIYFTSAPLRLDYAFSLAGKLPDDKRRSLTYPEFRPCRTAGLRSGESMIKQTARADRLLSFPFESMSPFLNLLKEASDDPNVISIKITIYRLARKAKLVEYLCNAAENGKDVTVFIELRARFDEQNNIDWSERLEDAGCTVFYGFENYKIHSKICLITRRERGEIQYITQVGTGNYNEKTAEQYTDVSLLTADPGIGQDAVEFFKNIQASARLALFAQAHRTAPDGRGDSQGPLRPHEVQDKLAHRHRHHRKAARSLPRRRAHRHGRARHLLHPARHTGRDGQHTHRQHSGTLPRALAHLHLRRGPLREDVHLLGRLHDPQHAKARGDRLPHLRQRRARKNPRHHGRLPCGQCQGPGAALRRQLQPRPRRRRASRRPAAADGRGARRRGGA